MVSEYLLQHLVPFKILEKLHCQYFQHILSVRDILLKKRI